MDETISPKIENTQQEIAALRERLSELENKYQESEPVKESAEIKKEALKSHIEGAEEAMHESYKISDQSIHDCKSTVGKKASENEQIQALFEIAKEKGVVNAFKVARAISNPHLLDAFHDAFIEHQEELLAEEIK